ncbi:TspO/MBR family protein [Ahrensia sp. R2A130]|uniref:TspO/MBR family protein n=1 Tax=Ahrensia sp. R2A130 TaxID=744979 RepID=UPI0001E0840B|nr:TspO/MBR family protein [Ahrensia sp. R2A130]EFL89065.1 protein CrtK [Ahrensia sp. R2A130]
MSWSLLAFVGVNFFAAMSGGIFRPDEWFRALNKPSWQPPDWAFPVVWTVLYLLNAVAGWMVFEQLGFSPIGIMVLAIYGISLALNAGWSAVFFGMKRIDLATWEAAALWLSLAVQIAVFWTFVPLAALLCLPYLLWVSIAFYLSLTIWRLNPQAVS